MAARRSTRRDDEDALDPVEAADVEDDESESESEDDLDDADIDVEDVEADDLDDDDAAEELTEVPDGFVTDEEPEDEAEAEVVPLAVFDDDEDEAITRVVGDDDEDDVDDVDGLRDGEFVCRSCFMAKRESALADAKRLLCRDCA